MEFAFKFVENLGEQELKSKDINYVSDLCYSLKVSFGINLWLLP